MESHNKLALEQLHIDLKAQTAAINELVTLIREKEFKALLPDRVKTEVHGKAAVEGEVVVTNDVKVHGETEMLNLPELQSFIEQWAYVFLENMNLPGYTQITNDNLNVTVKNFNAITGLLQQLIDKDAEVSIKGADVRVNFPKAAREAMAVRLVDKDGKNFYNAQMVVQGGGGGGNLSGVTEQGKRVDVLAVESADNPGFYGMVVLNPDGTSIGTGGGGGTPAETFKRITDNEDVRVTSTGDIRVFAT